MSNKTYFSLSIEKGLRGNIGKISLVESQHNEPTMNVMLFLVANNGSITDDRLHQIVNVHFPKESFETLKDYAVGDYVRVYFDRIDLAKSVDAQSNQERLLISVKANHIELLKSAGKIVKVGSVQETKEAKEAKEAKEPKETKTENLSDIARQRLSMIKETVQKAQTPEARTWKRVH